MSKSLMLVTQECLDLEMMLIENQGEITDTMQRFLEISEKDIAVKTDQYAYFIDHLDNRVEFFKQKALEIAHARKIYESQIDLMKRNLKLAMNKLDRSELKGESYRFVLSKTKPKVTILTEDNIPTKFIREKMIIEVDKDALKEALESGLEIDGVFLEESFSLRKYVTTK